MPKICSRAPWFGCLLAVLLVAASACSSTSDPEPLSADNAMQQITDATVMAGSASYRGQTTFANGSSGPIEGTSQAADPAQGQVSYPVLTPTGPAPVTLVWIDHDFYVERAVTDNLDNVSTILRLDSEKPWIQGSYQPLVSATFDAYDPFALLTRLTNLGVSAQPDGDETVDGQSLQRFTADVTKLVTPPAGARTAQLLVDDQHRLRHLRLLGDDTVEYSLADFGVDVAPTPPADDQIGVPIRKPPTSPTEPYVQVGQGTSPGGAWRLLRAPASDGGTCWQVESDVPLDLVAPTQPDGATCIGPLDPTDVADNQVAVVADAGAGAPFEFVVVAVAPGVTQVDLQLADRSRQKLTVDPAGFVVFTGPKPPLALVMEITGTDGTVVTCGPGSVTALDDLQSMPPEQIAALDHTAWLCLAL